MQVENQTTPVVEPVVNEAEPTQPKVEEVPEPTQEKTAEEVAAEKAEAEAKAEKRRERRERKEYYELKAKAEYLERELRRQEEARSPKPNEPESGEDFESLLEQKLSEREAKKAAESFFNKSKTLLEKAAEEGDFDVDDFIPIPKGAADAIVELDNPKLIAHLQKNPAEIEKLAQLSPARQAVEIGKLEAKLSQPVKKSAAPAPIKPVTGGNSLPQGLSDQMSTADWIKERNQQIYGKR